MAYTHVTDVPDFLNVQSEETDNTSARRNPMEIVLLIKHIEINAEHAVYENVLMWA